VDIAEVKHLVGDVVALIGNVNCSLLQSGANEEVVASAHCALEHGMRGGGYVLSTTNSIYTGMPLARNELMLDVWREEGG
jgi:uroporphyrinogen decarboxylase